MLYKQISIYNYKINNIDATVQGITLMGEPWPTGFRVTHLIVDLKSVSGLVSAPIVSLGKTSSSYDDIIPATDLAGLTNAANAMIVPASGIVPDIIGNDGLYFNVSTAASASTYTLDVTVVGFYDL